MLKKKVVSQNTETMEWSNLREHKCPKCYGIMVVAFFEPNTIKCSRMTCDFKMSQKRYDEILKEMINK